MISKYAVLAAAVFAGLLLRCTEPVAMPLPKGGMPAPDFQLSSIGGQPVSLSEHRGKVVIIDFFATWCKPCQQSVPFLIRMDRTYGPAGLFVLGLSMDGSQKSVLDFMDKYRTTYMIAMGDDMVQSRYGARFLPTMYVVDRKGVIRERFMGFSDDGARAMEILVKKLLAEK